ncbi:penicillin-binding protein activator [Desulfamplus magnetovallimortis]|nr:penicillin-binding protein activator [Desulfamplus magnetovallimortis]
MAHPGRYYLLIIFIFSISFFASCGVKEQPVPDIATSPPNVETEPLEPALPPSEIPELTPLEKREKEADANVLSGNYRAAVNIYNYLLGTYPLEKRQPVLEKIESLLSQMESNDIEMIMNSKINRILESMLLYRLGLSYASKEQYSRSRDILTLFVTKYPGHPDAKDAMDILGLLRDKSFENNKVGCILPLSGKFALFGTKALKGVQMALRDLTPLYKDKITLIIKDSESNDERAVACVRELAKENVAAIAGPMVTAMAAASEAQIQSIPMICMTQKSEVTEIGDYIFSNFLTPEMQVNALLNYSGNNLGVKRFALLYPDDKYGTTYMELFTKMAEEGGWQIVGSEFYSQDKIDFGDSVLKLKRFLGSSSSSASGIEKAVFIPDSIPKLAMILPQFAYHNVNDIYLLGTNIWHNQNLLRDAAGYVSNAVITEGFFPESRKEVTSKFAESFRLIYGESPGFIEAIAYDTVSILIKTAMDKEVASRASLKNILAGNRMYEGVTGNTMFGVSGKPHKELFLLTIENNQFVEISH